MNPNYLGFKPITNTKYFPSTKCKLSSRRANERIENRETSCPYDGKLFSKANKPQVGQWHEDIERKWEYHHIHIFIPIKKEEDK